MPGGFIIQFDTEGGRDERSSWRLWEEKRGFVRVGEEVLCLHGKGGKVRKELNMLVREIGIVREEGKNSPRRTDQSLEWGSLFVSEGRRTPSAEYSAISFEGLRNSHTRPEKEEEEVVVGKRALFEKQKGGSPFQSVGASFEGEGGGTGGGGERTNSYHSCGRKEYNLSSQWRFGKKEGTPTAAGVLIKLIEKGGSHPSFEVLRRKHLFLYGTSSSNLSLRG